MSALSRSLPFLFLLLGFGGLAVFAYLRPEPTGAPRKDLVPLVETVQVTPCVDGFSIHVDGEVVPYRRVTLASQVRGQVVKKAEAAQAGNFVRQGTLLYEIDARDYALEVQRIQEQLLQATASIEESDVEKKNIERLITLAEEQLVLQRSDTARIQKLRGTKSASIAALEAARRAELDSLNALQTLRNQVALLDARRVRLVREKNQATTSLELATINLSRTKITARLDGVVTEDLAEQDDFVQIGTPLVAIEDTSRAEIRFSLRLDQLRWLWSAANLTLDDIRRSPWDSYQLPKIPVRVHLEIAGYRFLWPARLDRYDGAGLNVATRTAPLIAIVESPTAVQVLDTGRAQPSTLPAPPTLLRGTYVTVEIPIAGTPDLLSIPSIALRPSGKVWKVRDGKLDIQEVEVAHASNKQVILQSSASGLAVGDPIVVSPLALAVDGMSVRTSEQAPNEGRTPAVASKAEPREDSL